MKRYLILLILFTSICFSQTNYNSMLNWAFHPNKTGTLIDGFNLDIAVINENLETTSIIDITNNAMTNTGIDVFFVHPTVLENMGSFTTVENIPISSQNTIMVASSIRGQVGLLSKYGRMFAPRYRQATPPTFINSPLDVNQANVLGVAYNDIKAAFLNYLTNFNNGNKIIIASHSQGSYLAGFLLKDVFDSNPELREKLIVASIAGITSNYAPPNEFSGGWWETISFCTQQEECGCVMNWRSYKEGQTPTIPLSAHPTQNPLIVSNGWAYTQLDLEQNWLTQDNLYYDDELKPLEKFITLRSNVDFGGTAGYVAFDDLYSIRHQRSSLIQVGFVVSHTPQPNDQRPNLLLDEESNPTFTATGYHQKDYNIYTWALLEQIDMKIASCATNLTTDNFTLLSKSLSVYPNPAKDLIYIKNNSEILKNEFVSFIDFSGKVVLSDSLNEDGTISIVELKNGFYFVKTKVGTSKLVVLK